MDADNISNRSRRGILAYWIPVENQGQLGAEEAVGARGIIITQNSFPFSQRSPGCVSREMAKFSQVELWSEAQMGWITVTTQEEVMHNLITHQPAVVLHFFNIPKIYSLLYIRDNS